MSVLARKLRQIRGARRQRKAQGEFRVIRDEQQLSRSAVLLAHYGGGSPIAAQTLLTELWDLDCTALYVQIEQAFSPADLVLTSHSRHRIAAVGQGFRVETETHEPAPDGAYLVDRQYRQLGFYETPPAERVIVVLRITAGSGLTYLVDVPHYVSHATVVVNNSVLSAPVPIPRRGELRFGIGAVKKLSKSGT